MPSLIGNKPNQVPSNGDLGTLAFQDADNAIVGNLNATGVTTVQAGTAAAPAITTTGDTNTGVFFPAADTIAFTEGGVEAMRINSSGNVGIGTASPVVRATISGTDSTPPALGTAAGTALFCNTSPAYGLLVGTSTGGWSWMQSQRVSGAATAYDLIIQPSGGGVNIGDSTTSVGTGCLRLTGNIGVGGATPATGGKGITFPTTQSASSNANTLDDYEEGTWTPIYQPETNSFPSIAYNTDGTKGRYVKVGRMVFVEGAIFTDGITVGTASGGVRLGGLPFTAVNPAGFGSYPPVCIGEASNFAGDVPSGGAVFQNTTYAGLSYRTAANGATTPLNVSDLETSGFGKNVIRFSISYEAA